MKRRRMKPIKGRRGSDLAKLLALIKERGWELCFPDSPFIVEFEHGGGVVAYWEGNTEKNPELASKARWFDRKGKETTRQALQAQADEDEKRRQSEPDEDDEDNDEL